MKYVDKCILVPIQEWNVMKQSKNSEKVDSRDESTMTDEVTDDCTKSTRNVKDVSTMTENNDKGSEGSTIIVLPPGVPKSRSKKRKIKFESDKDIDKYEGESKMKANVKNNVNSNHEIVKAEKSDPMRFEWRSLK